MYGSTVTDPHSGSCSAVRCRTPSGLRVMLRRVRCSSRECPTRSGWSELRSQRSAIPRTDALGAGSPPGACARAAVDPLSLACLLLGSLKSCSLRCFLFQNYDSLRQARTLLHAPRPGWSAAGARPQRRTRRVLATRQDTARSAWGLIRRPPGPRARGFLASPWCRARLSSPGT